VSKYIESFIRNSINAGQRIGEGGKTPEGRSEFIELVWIIQMSYRKHLIKFLSIWFIQWATKWFPFLLFYDPGYSKWRDCPTH